MIFKLTISIGAFFVAGLVNADSFDAYRVNCSTASLSKIFKAGDHVRVLAAAAAASLPPVNFVGGTRVKRWFGLSPEENTSDIKEVFNGVFDIQHYVTKFWCPNMQYPGVSHSNIAYVPSNGGNEIFVSPPFFELSVFPADGEESQVGTLLHEVVHRIDPSIGDDNRRYGVDEAEARASESSARAKSTADNYQYYAEDLSHRIP